MNDSKEKEHLNTYRNVLASLVIQSGGEMLVKLEEVQASLMWKLEEKGEETYVRLRVVVDNNVIPIN